MKRKLLVAIIVLGVLGIGGYFLTQQDDSSTRNGIDTTTSAETGASNSEDHNAHLTNLGLPSQTASASADCSLYTTEIITGVWGVPIVDTDIGTVVSTNDGGKQYTCSYNETDSGVGLTFSVEYREFMTEENARSDMMSVRNGATVDGQVYFVHEELQGVGDEAFFSTTKSAVDSGANKVEQLYIRKGHLVMLLTASNLDGVKTDYKEKLILTFRQQF